MAIEQFERSILLVGATAFLFVLGGQAALADDHGAGAGIRTVDCAKSNASVQKKIDRAKQGTRTTIVIKGTCTEDIVVQKDDLTFLAHPDGGTVQGSIDVIGAQRVTIDGLNVFGRSEAFTARDNASVTINGAEIKSKKDDSIAVLATDNASVTINGAKIESKKDDSIAVYATRSASVVMADTEVEATGKRGCAVYITDGSALRMNGGNTLINEDKGFNCATLTIVRNSTARIRGSGNKITNEGKIGISTSASGVALDSEVVSSLRIDPTMEDEAAVITGDVVSYNLASIDLRKAVINGSIFADGLNANIRLRGNNDGDVEVKGNVFPGDDSAVAIRTGGQVIIYGNIDCANGNNVTPNFPFSEYGEGTYVGCEFTP